MEDRLEWLMKHFMLRAKAFQSGPLTSCSVFEPQPSVGYIHLLQRGGIRVTNGGQDAIDITEPSVFFFLNPTHTLLEPLDDDVSIVCASLDFSLGAGNPLQAAIPDMCCLNLQDNPGLGELMRQLESEVFHNRCGRQSIINRLCEVGLVLSLRELMDNQRLDIGLLAGLADPKLHKALNAIHAEPAFNWGLSSMAKSAGMSRARFALRFRDVVGVTPAAYLADWRIGLAQSMLLSTNKDLKYISQAVGYGSTSALSRAFSKRQGVSPKAWLRHRSDSG